MDVHEAMQSSLVVQPSKKATLQTFLLLEESAMYRRIFKEEDGQKRERGEYIIARYILEPIRRSVHVHAVRRRAGG